jgi:chitinase
MLMYGFDGIDIYWQPYEDKAVTPEIFQQDRQAFIQFMIELRADLQRRKSDALLTVSMKMPCLMHPWKMEELAKNIDFVNLHAAYFHGNWEQTTNHISPIYDAPWQHSIDSMLSALMIGGMPPEKIILDIGTYGQAWQGIRDINHGLQQPATAISLGSWDSTSEYSGLYSRHHTQQIIAMPGYKEFWDDKAKASYAFNPDRYQGHFISYESIRSLDAKIDYMKMHKLRGIGLLDMHNEKHKHDSLLVHVHRKFYFWSHIGLSFNDFFKSYYQDILLFLKIIGLLGLVSFIIFLFYRKKIFHGNK